MTTQARFETALNAVKNWHAALPEVTAFCDWPTDLEWQARPAHFLPAADLIRTQAGDAPPASQALLAALQDLATDLEWRHSYTVEEVGQHFLDTFGWFELAGPQGHFITHQTRITVGYWGPGLDYGRHQHQAEELYTVVSGHAVFHSDGDPDATLSPGDTRFHASNQPHAMTTTDSPVLTLVFWRGEGLDDPPEMTPT